MKNIKLSYALLVCLLVIFWLVADPLLFQPYQFFALRVSMVNLSGIVAMGAMSVAMILAARPTGIERFLGGLDKMYRLHKWLGITGLVFAVAHWLWADVPKWLIRWGWLTRPARRPAAEQSSVILQFFQSQRGLAEGIGEWAFYAAVVLIVLALIKMVPYRRFLQMHRFLALVYLCLVFHSFVLMRFVYWGQVIGPLMAILMLAGTVAALVCLFRKAGSRRRVQGEVTAVAHYPDGRILAVDINTDGAWPGHEAGQFAFLTFDKHEGAHPFTISSAWLGDGRLGFHIKALGDYTKRLPDLLREGAPVRIEGPYGCFNFNGRTSRQIWVAGGIGIAPFLARMESLALNPDGRVIDLFYCTRDIDAAFVARLRKLATASGVRLHVLIATIDGRLGVERLCQTVPDWAEADVWFCGPTGFAKGLSSGLVAKGLQAENFHSELFEMR